MAGGICNGKRLVIAGLGFYGASGPGVGGAGV